MEYVAITMGAIALFVAWRATRRAGYLQDRLDAANNRYFTLVNQVRDMEENTKRELVDLRVEMKRQAGLLKFEPQMTIGEIYDMHPRAAEVLAGFHLGGCSSCAVSPDQTLASAAQQHNINLNLLVGALTQLADGKSASLSMPTHHGLTTDPDLRIIA
ncbi:MAG: hypothetical protein ABI874_07270 [Chloroflexota bacterium]